MDLRDFIRSCEEKGELKRIKVEVDWNLELSQYIILPRSTKRKRDLPYSLKM